MILGDNLIDMSVSIDYLIQWLQTEKSGGAEYVTVRINDQTLSEIEDDEELNNVNIKKVQIEAE